jgi:hypothetical protein
VRRLCCSFLKTIGIDKHVGVSTSVLRDQLTKMEILLPYSRRNEKQPRKTDPKNSGRVGRNVSQRFYHPGVDGLGCGYLFLEEFTEGRCFELGTVKRLHAW